MISLLTSPSDPWLSKSSIILLLALHFSIDHYTKRDGPFKLLLYYWALLMFLATCISNVSEEKRQEIVSMFPCLNQCGISARYPKCLTLLEIANTEITCSYSRVNTSYIYHPNNSSSLPE